MNIRENSVDLGAETVDPGSRPASPVESLLAAVVGACECMVEHTDLRAGLQAAVQPLGRLSGHDRAYVWELVDNHQICELVAEWDAPGVGCISDMTGTARLAVADYLEVWQPLLAGSAYQSITPLKSGANATWNEVAANRSDVMVPIFVGDVCWGCIGFDNCTEERRYSDAEIQALRGAAAAVAAAVQRSNAEARRLSMERQHANEALALNHLLEGVVQASRALLDASDFQQGLQRWLAYLAQAVDADAAMLGSFDNTPPAGALTTFNAYWARDGSPYQGSSVPASTDFVVWAERLKQGESVWAHRDELQDPASVAFWVETDCFSNLLMPVVCDGRTVGGLGFDWRERRTWQPAYAAALRTAADGVAAALQRQNAVQAMLAEREQRIAVEEARANEAARLVEKVERHAQLLAAVAASAEDLLAAREPLACMDAILARLSEKSGAQRAAFNRFDWTPDDPELRGWQEVIHEWAAPGELRQMDTPMRRFPMRRDEAVYDRFEEEFRNTGRLVINIAQQEERYRTDQESLGVAWSLGVPFIVDGEIWGALGFDYATPFERHDEAELSALQTVASTIADALIRQRLEARALAAESARADESARIAGLLEHVVSSSRTLIDADLQAFEPALNAWLGSIGLAVGAIRCTFYDIVDFEATGLRTARVLAEWARGGVEGSMPVSFASPIVIDPRGAESLIAQVTSGRAVVFQTDECEGPMREFLAQQGNATVVAVPLVMDGKPWGCLSFDHAERREPQPGEFAVLQTAADTLAAILKRNEAMQRTLSEREHRIAVEHARAEDSARYALRAVRHSRLLSAVAQSAEELLAARELAPSLDAVLQRIGLVTAADRLSLTRIHWTPDDPVLLGRQEITHEWTRQGAVRQQHTQHRWIEMRHDDATWPELWAQLRSQGRGLARIADLAEPFRSTQMALGVTWTLVYPVEVGGVLRGLLGFDYSTDIEDYDDADLAALQTVASTIADALLRQELEARALAAERARADESARLAALLTHVVSSSRTLIDVELQAFEPALLAWLGGVGSAVGATRCTFYDLVDFEGTGSRTVRTLAEWAQAGAKGSLPVSFAAPVVIDPRGAEPLMAQLTSGRAVAFHTEDTASPMREFLAQQGNATVVAVPLVMDGKPWGCLSFDYGERREPHPGELAVLQTAADTLTAILKRNEALRHVLAEREARLTAEQQRSSELTRANEALRQSLDALAGVGGETAFLSRSLVQLQEELGAHAAHLFCIDESDGRLRLMGRAAQGRFSPDPAPDDPAMFTHGFEIMPTLMARLRQHGRMLWRRVDPATPVDADTSEPTRWHLRMGHRADIVHALIVGERQVGFIGMVFDTDVPPTDALLDLANTLCQPITLALELSRLSRLAQRSSEQNAVLAERSRLAREIHDGIAQAFLAIQIQLEALEPSVQRERQVVQALDMARHGLAEARRAVAALRPQGLLHQDLLGALQRLLSQLDSRGLTQCVLDGPPTWQCLPPEVEDNLFRIVQEAANNALKHAQASHLRVELSQAAGEATVLISDDGVGFDPALVTGGRGFGLESMEQRAQLIGARIDLLSKPGKGTQVLVSWGGFGTSAPHAASQSSL